MVSFLRVLLNDFEEGTPEFSDRRLEQILAISARLVQQEIDLSTSYTISVSCPSISPDPTETATLDDVFTNMVVVKAACLVDTSSMRSAALSSYVNAKCGPAGLTTANRMGAFKDLAEKGYCAMYEEMKKDYQFGNTGYIKAILSPFINSDFFPSDYNTNGRI